MIDTCNLSFVPFGYCNLAAERSRKNFLRTRHEYRGGTFVVLGPTEQIPLQVSSEIQEEQDRGHDAEPHGRPMHR